MMIACPRCGTSYAVEADAFGPRARTVECSACGERWLQEPAAQAVRSSTAADTPAAAASYAADPDGARASPLTATPVDVPLPHSHPFADTSGPLAPDRPPPHEIGAEAPPTSSGNATPGKATAAESAANSEDPALPGETAPEAAPAREPVAAAMAQSGATSAPRQPPTGRGIGKVVTAWQALQRMRKQIMTGGIASAATLCALGAIAIMLREPLVALLPGAAGVYGAVGLASDPIGDGLEIRDVTSMRAREGGEDVLMVRGVVANTSDSERPLPPLRVSLWNASDEEVQSATVTQGRGRLAPGETVPFESRLLEPPPEARSLRVGFAQPNS